MEMMTMRFAATIPATLRPVQAPLAIAWKILASEFPSSGSLFKMVTCPRVSGSSVSGTRILEMAIEMGIDIKQDEMTAWPLAPRLEVCQYMSPPCKTVRMLYPI